MVTLYIIVLVIQILLVAKKINLNGQKVSQDCS